MYLSTSPSNEQGSLTETQRPWEKPATGKREYSFVNQAHSNAMATSYQLGNKSWNCQCLSSLHDKMGDS